MGREGGTTGDGEVSHDTGGQGNAQAGGDEALVMNGADGVSSHSGIIQKVDGAHVSVFSPYLSYSPLMGCGSTRLMLSILGAVGGTAIGGIAVLVMVQLRPLRLPCCISCGWSWSSSGVGVTNMSPAEW